jgi:hypothetical protein
MMITALALVFAATSATQEPTPSPRFTLDAPDPRAPATLEAEWGDEEVAGPAEPAATPAPAPVSKKSKKAANMLGRQPVIRGGVESGFATLDIAQLGIGEKWNISLDGGAVGKLTGNESRVRVGMIRPGKHKLVIFNSRGILWSGRVEVRAGQTLVLEARESGLQASDAMALQSDAEAREARVASER